MPVKNPGCDGSSSDRSGPGFRAQVFRQSASSVPDPQVEARHRQLVDLALLAQGLFAPHC